MSEQELPAEPEPVLAKVALGLFVGGIIVPILITAVAGSMGTPAHKVEQPTLILGVACEVLALVLGLAGRQGKLGRLSSIGAAVFLAWAVGMYVHSEVRQAAMERDVQEKISKLKAEAEAQKAADPNASKPPPPPPAAPPPSPSKK